MSRMRWFFIKHRRKLSRWWDVARAPWPVVGECYLHRDGGDCPQCDGSHQHVWASWPGCPDWIATGPGVPVRCRTCGTRKCDDSNCIQRRHHREPHLGYDGTVRKVGV